MELFSKWQLHSVSLPTFGTTQQMCLCEQHFVAPSQQLPFGGLVVQPPDSSQAWA